MQDVFLHGGIAQQLFAAARWTGRPVRGRELEREFRLWTLGSTSTEIAHRLFGIPRSQLGIIPRDALFPRCAPARAFPRKSERWALVFSGRMSPYKNFTLWLRVASWLQTEFGWKAEPVCFGAFEDLRRTMPERPIVRGVIENYEDEVMGLVSRLPWTIPPRFEGYTADVEDWIRARLPSPVYFSVSQFEMEDFGVSAAQAQAAGWPCILSDWGGHRDVGGRNVIHLPPIPHLGDSAGTIEEGRALAIAARIDAGLRSGGGRRAYAPPSVLPRPIGFRELLSAGERFRRRYFPTVDSRDPVLRFRDRGGAFQRSAFLSAYFSLMAGGSSAPATVVFSAGRRSDWASMDEILPALETAWAATGTEGTVFLKPAGTAIAGALDVLAGARRLVFTEVSPELIALLRREFALKAPLVIHTHGEGAEGASGFADIQPYLRSGDRFVCASRAEAKAMRALFPAAGVSVVPFPLAPRRAPGLERAGRRSGGKSLIYAGRISEQKNLHDLFVAVSILKRRHGLRPKLELYGISDGHGLPHLGRAPREDYVSELRRLAGDLGISGQVRWRGFLPRSALESRLRAGDHVFVSASVHSNEDFGAAAFHALESGNRAVLSAWGGHLDFAEAFGEQVRLVPVRTSPLGPFVSADDLASALQHALRDGPVSRRSCEAALRRYTLVHASKALSSIEPKAASGPLRTSELFRKIRDQHRRYRVAGEASRVFSGYDDPLYAPLLAAYGAHRAPPRARSSAIELVPWARTTGGAIDVDDPRRGKHRIRKDLGSARLLQLGIAFGALSR